MEPKKTGHIDRHRSDFDVMEHVINGWYPALHRPPEPRGRADDRDPSDTPRGQRTTHPKRKLLSNEQPQQPPGRQQQPFTVRHGFQERPVRLQRKRNRLAYELRIIVA